MFTLLKRIKNNVRIKSNEVDIYNFELRMSPLLKWVSLISSSVFGLLILLMTLFPNDSITAAIYIIFSTFFLSSLFLFLYLVTNKIKINVNNITYYSFFRRPKQYTFDMIEKLVIKDKNNSRDVIVFGNSGKFFSFSSFYSGFDTLMLRFAEKQILTEYRQTQTFNSRTINESMEQDMKPRPSALSIAAIITVISGVLCNLLGMGGDLSIFKNVGILICVAAIIISIADLIKSGSYKTPTKSDGSLISIILGVLVCFINGIIYLWV